jgi:hypothetical protein
MKTKEEIEQLAKNSSYNNSEHFEDYQDGMFYGYKKIWLKKVLHLLIF